LVFPLVIERENLERERESFLRVSERQGRAGFGPERKKSFEGEDEGWQEVSRRAKMKWDFRGFYVEYRSPPQHSFSATFQKTLE
jgi:hypothetical protein